MEAQTGTWVFGGVVLLFIICAFFWGPKKLPTYKQRLIAVATALLPALLAHYLSGAFDLKSRLPESVFGEVDIDATGGLAAFVFVLIWWITPWDPARVLKKLRSIKKDTEKIIELLEVQLQKKDERISSLESRLDQRALPRPSEQALELAKEIPQDAGPYALALKAIAERKFEAASFLLDKSEKENEVAPEKIYSARGDAAYYSGRYPDAVQWYKKLFEKYPKNMSGMKSLALSLYASGKYFEAEPLYHRVIETEKETLGENHQGIAVWYNNIASLYKAQGKYSKLEPLYERAIAIGEETLGKDHQSVASYYSNLAGLYRVQGKYCEAEPLYMRAIEILEGKLGESHPDVATCTTI